MEYTDLPSSSTGFMIRCAALLGAVAIINFTYSRNVVHAQAANTHKGSEDKRTLKAAEVLKASMTLKCCDLSRLSNSKILNTQRSRGIAAEKYHEIDENLEKCLGKVISNGGSRKQIDTLLCCY